MRNGIYPLAIVAIIIVAVAALLVLITTHAAPHPASLQINGREYGITSYAYTQQQREKGLMNTTVTNSTLMLFRFDSSGIYPFWMKNTYSQLDIIWLDYNQSDGIARVAYVVNATPCIEYSANQSNCVVYTPTSESNYVVEAKAGFVEQNNISIGTTVGFIR